VAGFDKYDNHDNEWVKCLEDPERKAVAASWLRDDTVDAWRHRRMRETLLPLIKADQLATCLTVGDGRYGTDAHFFLEQGIDCHASDMTSRLLGIAHNSGYIREYSLQNAESLTFKDGTFDYVYCKESFHHFPRPWLAVYEMFRVARKAVILLEPADNTCFPPRACARMLKDLGRRLIGRTSRNDERHDFEPVGNYIYSLSLSECEKFLLGMHYRWIASIGLNDYYEEGVEFCPLSGGSSVQRALKERVQREIDRRDKRCQKGLSPYSLLSAILFKTEPSEQVVAGLGASGWLTRQLPANPYRDIAESRV